MVGIHFVAGVVLVAGGSQVAVAAVVDLVVVGNLVGPLEGIRLVEDTRHAEDILAVGRQEVPDSIAADQIRNTQVAVVCRRCYCLQIQS